MDKVEGIVLNDAVKDKQAEIAAAALAEHKRKVSNIVGNLLGQIKSRKAGLANVVEEAKVTADGFAKRVSDYQAVIAIDENRLAEIQKENWDALAATFGQPEKPADEGTQIVFRGIDPYAGDFLTFHRGALTKRPGFFLR